MVHGVSHIGVVMVMRIFKQPLFLEPHHLPGVRNCLLRLLHQPVSHYFPVPTLDEPGSSGFKLKLDIFVEGYIIRQLQLILNVTVHQRRLVNYP